MARKATNTLESSLAEVLPGATHDAEVMATFLEDGVTHEDAFGTYPGPPRNLDPVRVTDYDAAGEAVDHDAATFTQGELPGMPEALPPLWVRIDEHRVGRVKLAFSGNLELVSEQDELAAALVLGSSVRLIVECNIDGKHFALQRKKGHAVGLDGTAVLKVVAAELADRDVRTGMEAIRRNRG